jgi:hypothetical protein
MSQKEPRPATAPGGAHRAGSSKGLGGTFDLQDIEPNRERQYRQESVPMAQIGIDSQPVGLKYRRGVDRVDAVKREAVTGARTPEGKQRQAEGRRRWRENLRAEGRRPGPAKGRGGRPRGSHNPSPETKAQRQLAHAMMRLVRARAALRRANSASPEYRRKRREARQEAEREVQRLLKEYQDERRAYRMPPLSGDALDRVIEGFRQRAEVYVPFDPTPRWPNVDELEDKVRDAEDALEQARAEFGSLGLRALE